jgi:formylglycine-generating enzyme required for sulfatase activity
MPKILIQRHEQKAQHFIEDLGNEIKLEMVLIPSGIFMMGSPKYEKASRDSERPQHKVAIKSFCLGKYPVTQAQWKEVAALPQVNQELNSDPSTFKGANRPVESISWLDAVEFCLRLSNYTKREYRLPSETEWEYACRARTTTPFHFGETISTDLANYNGNYIYGDGVKGINRSETTEVGSFEVANNFGLYDMHGNVYEWCQDKYHDSYEETPSDESAWEIIDNNDNHSRVLRSASWLDNPEHCRSAVRDRDSPNVRGYHSSLRVVLSGVPRTM